jgi:hypothetical protein
VWNDVVRGKDIPADLETSLLHVKTNSAVGSGDKTVIWYYDADGNSAAGIDIKFFSGAVKYVQLNCQYYKNFPVSLPEEQDKHWMIEKRGHRTRIYCNGKLVLDITVSSETCDNPKYSDTWDTYWEREVASIEFSSEYDTASISFYIG